LPEAVNCRTAAAVISAYVAGLFGLTRFAQRGDGNRERRHGSQDRYGDYAFRHPYMMTQDPLLG